MYFAILESNVIHNRHLIIIIKIIWLFQNN